jgi:catechol 2,3-dioxygenase-like lactoylglutathione lyase family enzyme
MKPTVTSCYQLGFITHSMEAMTETLQQTLGVPEFFQFPDIQFADLTYCGEPASCRVNVAIGYSGNTQIEVVEPISGHAAYSDFLAAGREGLHHIAVLAEDFDAELDHAKASGRRIIQSGAIGAERAIRFAYIDTSQTLGIVTELLWLAPSMTKLYERIRDRGLRQLRPTP